MLLATKAAASRSGKFFAMQQRDLGKVNGYIEEMMNGQKVVKVFCHENEAINDFNKLNTTTQSKPGQILLRPGCR